METFGVILDAPPSSGELIFLAREMTDGQDLAAPDSTVDGNAKTTLAMLYYSGCGEELRCVAGPSCPHFT